jgi:hypothetical protein
LIEFLQLGDGAAGLRRRRQRLVVALLGPDPLRRHAENDAGPRRCRRLPARRHVGVGRASGGHEDGVVPLDRILGVDHGDPCAQRFGQVDGDRQAAGPGGVRVVGITVGGLTPGDDDHEYQGHHADEHADTATAHSSTTSAGRSSSIGGGRPSGRDGGCGHGCTAAAGLLHDGTVNVDRAEPGGFKARRQRCEVIGNVGQAGAHVATQFAGGARPASRDPVADHQLGDGLAIRRQQRFAVPALGQQRLDLGRQGAGIVEFLGDDRRAVLVDPIPFWQRHTQRRTARTIRAINTTTSTPMMT